MAYDATRLPAVNLSGIPTDYVAVTTSDTIDNVGDRCIGIYATVAGNIRIETYGGTRDLPITAQSPLPIICSRVFATGTTATGIFAIQG